MNAKDAIKQIRQESAPEAPTTETPASHSAARAEAVDSPKFDPQGPWEAWMQNALDKCKERFIGERVSGFIHRGKQYAPVPLEEAQQRWAKKEESFKGVLQNDAQVAKRLREQHEESAKTPVEGTTAPAAPTEPPAT